MADESPPKHARTKLTVSLDTGHAEQLAGIARYRTLTDRPTTPAELAAAAVAVWADGHWPAVAPLLDAAQAAVRQATQGAAQ